MKRVDLQQLAKQHGVKANTKSSQIVSDLIPILSKLPAKDVPPTPPPMAGKENSTGNTPAGPTPSQFGTPLSSFTQGGHVFDPLMRRVACVRHA